MSWQEREDGMVDVRARLPKEAAVLLAALEAAKDQFGQPPDKPLGETQAEPTYSQIDALLDVARGFLHTAPDDRSGEDRTLVMVHVSAENLAAPGGRERSRWNVSPHHRRRIDRTGDRAPAAA